MANSEDPDQLASSEAGQRLNIVMVLDTGGKDLLQDVITYIIIRFASEISSI